MAKQRRVTVFGGTGFIGRYVVKRLAERGDIITVASRYAVRATHLQPLGDVGQITLINTNIRDEAAIDRVVKGSDFVINLVGILAEGGRQRFDGIQSEGATLIAKRAAAAHVGRFVHVSAIGADTGSPSAYARTKGLGEDGIRTAFPTATILRPSLVIGPEDQFFNRFAAMAQFLPFLPLIGGGQTEFQPVYVGDVADAVLACLDQPATQGRIYELGGPRRASFKELMQILAREIDRPTLPLIEIPVALAAFMAGFAEYLPNPPLTRDQIILLQKNNVTSPDLPGFADLGLTPTPIEAVIPSYLGRFRRGGWFTVHQVG